MKLRWLMSLVLLMLMAPVLLAQDDGDKKDDEPKEDTFAEKFDEIRSAHRKMMQDLGKKFRSAEGDDAMAEIMASRRESEKELSAKAFALVETATEDDDTGMVLGWVLQNGEPSSQLKAAEHLLKDAPEELAKALPAMGRGAPSPTNEKILRMVINGAEDDETKAGATMGLISLLSGLERFHELPDEVKTRFASSLGEGGAEFLETWSAEKINEEVETLLNVIVEKYADVKAGRGKTYGEMAENRLFAIKYLSIGKVAPDIEGEDLDGEAFKLSDYRGKVVVIDFWGDW